MAHSPHELDVLLIGEHSLWPIDQGFRIRGSNMTRALCDAGVHAAYASIEPCPADAPASLCDLTVPWPATEPTDIDRLLAGWSGPGARLRRKLADFQGRNLQAFAGVLELVKRHRPAAVVGLGQHSTLMLRALPHSDGENAPLRVWYAADELLNFQISCMKRESIAHWPQRLRHMALYGGLEALFVRGLEGAVGVSPHDTRLLRRIAGARDAVTIRNGVDLDYFTPGEDRATPQSLVFWGRMDFEPNIDAVLWFAKQVWPRLHARFPRATWQIVGKKPTDAVQRLGSIDGITVTGAVDDIRPYARGASLTILPMRCGGGIKNKLLEAAAMGRPILATPRATRGLTMNASVPPVHTCTNEAEFVASISEAWTDANFTRRLGVNARNWVQQHHSWDAAAAALIAWLETHSALLRNRLRQRRTVGEHAAIRKAA